MIEQVRGQLEMKKPTFAVVDVQGVGYGMSISLATYQALPAVGNPVLLLTYLYVREDRMDLFGFADTRERSLFRLLLGVSGIGPYSALAVLSGLTLDDLEEAISQGRVSELTSIKGIGRKTAERIVLDLRDKVSPAVPLVEGGPSASTDETNHIEEAEKALIALGIAPAVARQAVGKVRKKSAGELGVQELIKQALRER